MSKNYLYNVEFTVDDFDLWTYPENLTKPEECSTILRFTMKPSICLEIGEDEFIDQVNCDKKVVKNTMFSLSEHEMQAEAGGKIVVYKAICPENEEMVGYYKFSKLQNSFKQLTEEFHKHSEKKDKKCARKDQKMNQPTHEVIKQLVQLVINLTHQISQELC